MWTHPCLRHRFNQKFGKSIPTVISSQISTEMINTYINVIGVNYSVHRDDANLKVIISRISKEED